MSGPTPAYVSRRRSSLDDESDEPTASPRAQSTTKRSRLESGLSSVEHLAHDVVVAAETVESGASVGRRMVSRRRFEQVDDPRRMNECVDWDGAGQQRREKFESGRSRHGIDSFRASLHETRELVDEIRHLSREITIKRQALTRVPYTSFRRYVKPPAGPFTSADEHELEMMTTTVRRHVLVAYQAIQALKADFRGCSEELSGRDKAMLSKELKRVYADFADRLDLIEVRTADEEREVENGSSDERLRQVILEHSPGMQEQEVLRELKLAREEQRTVNVNKLSPTSFSYRLALEMPFFEISRSLSVIDEREGRASRDDAGAREPSPSRPFLKRIWSSIKHSFWHTRATAAPSPPPPYQESIDVLQSRSKDSAVLLEEGKKDQKKKGKRRHNEDSDSDISISELLGPDGQLPYSVPADDPNGNSPPEDPLAEAKHKYKLQKHARPFLIAEWVFIAVLILYWAIARYAFHWPNPLGNVDLGSHFGDDAWGDTDDGVPGTLSMSSFQAQATTAEPVQPSQLMDLLASAQEALTAVRTAAPSLGV